MSETTTASPLALEELVARIAAEAFDSQIFTVYTNTKKE
jgi:hypothetical protein